MSPTRDDLAGAVTPLREDLAKLRARLAALVAETHHQDLEHALFGLRFVDHALEETAAHAGLGGTIRRAPDLALRARVADLEARLGQLRADAASFLAEHPNEDLETTITALAIAGGSLHEVVARYETSS